MIAVALITRARILPTVSLGLVAAGVALASALMLSFSRGSLIALLVALAVLLVLERKRVAFGRLLAFTIAATGATVAVLYATVPLFVRLYWYRIVISVQYIVQAPDQVLSGRLQSWSLLGDFLLMHPGRVILGIGYKTLPYSGVAGAPVIADNTYLSALVETGVFGLAAVIALNIVVLKTTYRTSRSSSERSALGLLMFCFWAGQSVQMLTVDLLTYWRVLPIYFCVLGLATQEEAS
jgi:O-antigen ligase